MLILLTMTIRSNILAATNLKRKQNNLGQ